MVPQVIVFRNAATCCRPRGGLWRRVGRTMRHQKYVLQENFNRQAATYARQAVTACNNGATSCTCGHKFYGGYIADNAKKSRPNFATMPQTCYKQIFDLSINEDILNATSKSKTSTDKPPRAATMSPLVVINCAAPCQLHCRKFKVKKTRPNSKTKPQTCRKQFLTRVSVMNI
jgi:hypothetical protein